MTLLTVTEYLYWKLPRICSFYRIHHNLSSFMTYHGIFSKCNISRATKEQEYPTLPEHLSLCVLVGFVYYFSVFCRLLLTFCLFFFWSLHCLYVFELRFLIKPLVASDFYLYKYINKTSHFFQSCVQSSDK